MELFGKKIEWVKELPDDKEPKYPTCAICNRQFVGRGLLMGDGKIICSGCAQVTNPNFKA